MSRKSWRRSEEVFLIENYQTMTTKELVTALERSEKSINRKIEKFRDEGKIGHRSKETVRRAYNQRTRKTKAELRSSGRKKGKLPVDDYTYEEV